MSPSGELASRGPGRRARAGVLAALALGFAAGVAWGALEGPAGGSPPAARAASRIAGREVTAAPSRARPPAPPPLARPGPPTSTAVPPGVAAAEVAALRALPGLARAPTASALGLVRERPEEVRALAEAADAMVACVRMPAATGRIEGRVVGPDGAPRASVRVRATCDGSPLDELVFAGFDAPQDLVDREGDLLRPLLRAAAAPLRRIDGISDAEGRFSLAVVPDVEYTVASRTPGIPNPSRVEATATSPSRCARVVVREGAAGAVLRLHIERGVASDLDSVAVMDERLKPVPQDPREPWARRLLVGLDGDGQNVRRIPGAREDDVRTLEMTVPTGTVRIRAMRERGDMLSSRPEVLRLEAGDVVERTLRLEPWPSVRVRILLPEGDVGSEELYAIALRWPAELPPPTPFQMQNCEHRNGTAYYEGVRPDALDRPVTLPLGEGGLAYVAVRRAREGYLGRPVAVSVPDTGTVDVEWRMAPALRAPSLRVTVLDARGGPASGVVFEGPGRVVETDGGAATALLELEEALLRGWREGRRRLTLSLTVPRAPPPHPGSVRDEDDLSEVAGEVRHEIDLPPQEGDQVTVRLPAPSGLRLHLEGAAPGPPLRVFVVHGADAEGATHRRTFASWPGWQPGRTLALDDLPTGAYLAYVAHATAATPNDVAGAPEEDEPPAAPPEEGCVAHGLPLAWTAFTTAPGAETSAVLRLPALHSLEVSVLRAGGVSVTPAREPEDSSAIYVDPTAERARLRWAWLPAGVYRVRFGPRGVPGEEGETWRLVRVPAEPSVEVGGER